MFLYKGLRPFGQIPNGRNGSPSELVKFISPILKGSQARPAAGLDLFIFAPINISGVLQALAPARPSVARPAAEGRKRRRYLWGRLWRLNLKQPIRAGRRGHLAPLEGEPKGNPWQVLGKFTSPKPARGRARLRRAPRRPALIGCFRLRRTC